MPLGAADRIFRSTDDQIFVLPSDDKKYKPQAQYVFIPGIDAHRPITQASAGDISWFATISPDISQATGMVANVPTAGGPTASAYGGNALNVRQFVVSVAACFKREITAISTLTAGTPNGERTVNITFPTASAVNTTNNTGDAWLWGTGITNKDQADQWLNVRADQWLLVLGVGGKSYAGSVVGGSQQVTANWYRVLAASDTANSWSDPTATSINGQWARLVRLQGPDWGLTTPTGYAVIVDGVIGVFQKTITVDGTSDWSL
jgi:hypothetical protein